MAISNQVIQTRVLTVETATYYRCVMIPRSIEKINLKWLKIIEYFTLLPIALN